MKKQTDPSPETWQGRYNAFKKLLPTVSNAHSPSDIFRDVCRIFSLSLRGTVTIDKAERDEIESMYASLAGRYGPDGMKKVGTMFAHLVEALELKRSDFLGHVYEDLNATVKSFGQFFTPDSVSALMAKVTFAERPEPGRIVKMNDCACGAGALLIEGAEAFVEAGGRQGDMLILAEDLDATACCIAYTQLSLLGYPAVVRRMDSLSVKVYEGPWYTPGYFLHGMPMRRPFGMDAAKDRPRDEIKEAPKEIDVRQLVQAEFSFGEEG